MYYVQSMRRQLLKMQRTARPLVKALKAAAQSCGVQHDHMMLGTMFPSGDKRWACSEAIISDTQCSSCSKSSYCLVEPEMSNSVSCFAVRPSTTRHTVFLVMLISILDCFVINDLCILETVDRNM